MTGAGRLIAKLRQADEQHTIPLEMSMANRTIVMVPGR